MSPTDLTLSVNIINSPNNGDQTVDLYTVR